MKCLAALLGRIAAALVLVAAVSGCSVVRFAYDNADTYLHWRATSYLDLHGEAVDELHERIQQLLAWHRTQALPQYVRIADDAARRLSRGLARQDLDWGYDSLMVQARQSLHAAAGCVAPMLDLLTPAQLAHLEERLAEDNRKFARENLRGSEEERRQRRARRAEEQLEDWVGRLSQTQVDRIRRFSERAPLAAELRDRDRKRIQAEVLAMIRAGQAAARLPEFAANWQRGRDPAFAAVNEAWRQEVSAMLLDIERTLTPAQRARAVAQLQRYARDMRMLAAKAEP